MRIADIPLGRVISINGQQFTKISQNTVNGGQFIAIQQFYPATTMQGWNGCSSLATPTATNFTQGPTLIDARDGKSYEIRKFADGKCWMVDNLAYGGKVDACANKTSFDGGANLSGNAWGYGDCRNNPGPATYGYLYNWQAVVQDASAYDGNDYQPIVPVQGICPTGWHIPSGNTSGEFPTLHIAAGSPATGFWQGGNWKGVFSGMTNYSNILNYQESHGWYWSSTQRNSSSVQVLHLHGDGVNSGTNHGDKDTGFSVRCVKN